MTACEDVVGIGIDVGGSKIAAALVDVKGHILAAVTRVTPAREGPDAVFGTLVEMSTELCEAARKSGTRVLTVGLATAGIVAQGSGQVATVTNALPGWSGVPIAGQLSARLGLSVVLVNDCQAMATGESSFGVGRDAPTALYISVGTGVGGAIAHYGTVYRGNHGSAGDIGHVLVNSGQDAPACGCGRRGHLEAYVCGPALAGAYNQKMRDEPGARDLREVASRAHAGDATAAGVLIQGANLLGRAVGGLANFLDPDVVVFGGGLLALGQLFWPFFEEALAGEVRSSAAIPGCVPARLGNNAAVVGAAVFALKANQTV